MKYLVFTMFVLLSAFPELIFAQIKQNRTPNFSIFQPHVGLSFRKKPTKEQKKLLEPKAEDLMRYAQFLAQPKTGMFRLLPDLGCEENSLVLKADEACLNAIPNSSLYSFREEEYASPILADIRLKNGFFVSDGVLSQGILTNLGDVALEKLSLGSEGLDFLRSYQPQELSREAHRQHLQMVSGVRTGKYEYRKIHSAIENSTYALRVIAYKGSIYRSFRGYRYDLLGGDKRIDLTIAFRVIRKESDNSLTLLWKELERRESPKLKYIRKNQSK